MVLRINIFNFLFLVLVIPISFLLEGIRRKLIARMQGRIGPSIWQPFYDIIKLFESNNSKENKNIILSTISFIYLITSFSLFLFIPFPIIGFHADFIFLIYILILNSALYILLGIITNSFYDHTISMKEMSIMFLYDIIFAIIILTFISFTNIQSLANFNERWLILKLPIASICLFIIVLVESRITPYNTVENYSEMIGSAETEVGGKELALFEISKNLKLTFFVFLMTLLFFGFKDLIRFAAISLITLFVLTFIQATTGRYRLDQIFKILIIVLFLSILELIRIKLMV